MSEHVSKVIFKNDKEMLIVSIRQSNKVEHELESAATF